MEEGESGISCQLSSRVSWFLLVERELGGAEFHFLVRILLRIDKRYQWAVAPCSASGCDLGYHARRLAQFVTDGAPFKTTTLVVPRDIVPYVHRQEEAY